ncbi:MAG: 50S ribosomal protein L25/general stress protein Ctc [Brooklawnia sp.]
MADIKMTAEARAEFGKGAARRIRRANKVPAVLYGRGSDPVHIALPGHETMLALRQANALLNLTMPNGEEQLALPKQVSRHPVRNYIEHVDLIIVRRGERVQVQVPIVLVGEAAPDTLVNQDLNELLVSAEATAIPASIEVSIEGLDVGDQVLAGEVKLPEGVELEEDDPDALVVGINAPVAVEDLLAEDEAAEDAEVDEDAEDAGEGADETE